MAEKGSRHRFELSRLEMAGVAVSTAAGFFVVFLLGIYAGRGMVERRLEEEQQVVRLPVPAVTAEPEAPDREPTFDERLGAAAGSDEEHTLAAAPPPRVDAPSEPRPTGSAGPERAAAPPIVPERAPAFPPPAVVPPPAAPPVRVEAPTPVRTPEARVAVAVAKATEPPPAAGRGEWTVQVAATRDPRHAQSIAKRLTDRGYQASIKQVKRAGETFFRVRVGRFPTPEDANKMVSRLRKEPGVPEAFVASD